VPSRPASALALGLGRLQALYRAMVRVRMPRIFGVVLRNPRDSLCAVMLALAVTAIVANSLYLQPGRHPAPIFAIRPLPVRSEEATTAAAPRTREAESTRESARAESGRAESARPESARPEPAAKPAPVPVPRPRAQTATASARPGDAGDATSPSWQIIAIQRTLNQAGFGPIRVSGILDDSTREGIARFERAHNLPVTGQNTPRVRHAISAATGRSLD
jgi:hypothetical protein